jgi:putative FmdB family regulatory protein
MPIYAYRCEACGHAKDVLQKLSDAQLTACPACGAEAFQKQVTSAGFQLKGSGWYVTDFKGNGQNKPASSDKGDVAPAGGATTDAKAAQSQAGKGAETASSAPAAKTEGATDKAAGKAAGKSADKPAAKPADKPPSSTGSALP